MTILAILDIYKNEFNLSPSNTQNYMSIIGLPWTPKLLYGIFTDTFPICGSRKKSYIVLCGLLQAFSSLAIAAIPGLTAHHITLFCVLSSMSSAVMDVVVDGLMVMMARKDPNFGSEDLQTYSWDMYGFGGVVGSLIGGEITKSFDPHYAFYVISMFGFLISITGIMLSSSLENSDQSIINMTFYKRACQVCKEVWKGLKIRELNRSILFFILMGCVIPSFTNYIYYFQMDVTGFSKF